MNTWMSHPFTYPERPIDRGKVLDAEIAGTLGEWGRYKDVDGDGIPYRSIPGTGMPAYFTRGSGHNEKGAVQRAAGRLRQQRRSAARGSSRPRGSTCRGRDRGRDRTPRSASSPTAPATGRSTRAAISSSGSRPADRLPAAARVSVHARRSTSSSSATSASTSSSRTATRRCSSLMRIDACRRVRRGCAACCTTTACRSTRARDRRHPRCRSEARSRTSARTAGVSSLTRLSSERLTRRLTTPDSRQEDQPHRPRDGPVSRRQDDAVRRLRPQRDLRAHHRRVLRDGRRPAAASSSSRASAARARARPTSSAPPHGFNSVHGRMPSVGTGALLANRKLIAIGVSGDGDTGAIGIGQFVHLMRRNVPLIYIIEDNGCYGLTKGQFSPTADIGSTTKNGVVNDLPPIDTCSLAIELGASFVARSFSGDKKQLLTILKAALAHRGTCMIDVHLAVRDVQRSRGLDQELRLRQGARRGARRDQLRPVLRGHLDRVRAGHDDRGDDARRFEAVPEEGGRGLQPDRQAWRRCGCCTKPTSAASSRPASSTSSPTRTTLVDLLNIVDEPLATLARRRVRPPKSVLDEFMEAHR